MVKYKFHRPGLYAHADPKIKHLRVLKDKLVVDVCKDMQGQCSKWGWAEPVSDQRESTAEPVSDQRESTPEAPKKRKRIKNKSEKSVLD